MKMQKKQFRIGELAKCLAVERFVIRFWEKEFNVSGHRSQGGQRFYEEKDLERFRTIKRLLYEQGFTIAGAKKQFKKNHTPTTVSPYIIPETSSPKTNRSSFIIQLKSFREKLLTFKKNLSR